MVKFCEGCEASYEEGTPCDCGNFLACNGDITAPGVFAFRYQATLSVEAVLQFVRDGRWDGRSSVDCLMLAIPAYSPKGEYERWGNTYDILDWCNSMDKILPSSPYPNGHFEVHGELVMGEEGIRIL